ncbi:hypothetical protein [Nocardia sp. 348MFTsu5.1]|uniref:hypothetical protein n=1 Tax=Nocardia sp. 348MFTsu5.1 TaxID=1172185 RepID=UPI0012DE8AC1|nr:hypothetical protein [Nocardia sp. 348MFTsu5.1]
MPSSQDRPSVQTPAEHRLVNTPTTAMPSTPPQPGHPERTDVDTSRATTAPVPAARHAAPPVPERRLHTPPVPERRLQAPPAPNPAQTAQFHRPPAASPRPGTYAPPAAYSATPYPAQPNHAQPNHAQPNHAQPYHPGYPNQPYPAVRHNPQPAYRPADVEPSAVRMTTTTQRPHNRVDTSVVCAAAALILLALAVLVGLML